MISNLPQDLYGVLNLQDVGPQIPPDNVGTAALFVVDGVAYYRDVDGVLYPLVVGGQSGVVEVAFADSPYDIQDTDRVILVNTTAGAVTLKYPAAGGPVKARKVTIVDQKRQFGTNACTLNGNGNNINGAATLVLSDTDSVIDTYWADPTWETDPGAAAAVFDPHSPGPIGDTVASTVAATTLTATNATVNNFLKSDNQLGVKSVGLAGGLAGYVKQLGLALATTAVEQAFQYATNAVLTLANVSVGATSRISLHTLSSTLADNATVDYDNGGKGGLMLLVSPGPTGSTLGIVSFAQNAVTTLNGGPAYTGFSVTLTTAGKINVGASGGKVRIENKTGGSVEIFALILLGVAA